MRHAHHKDNKDIRHTLGNLAKRKKAKHKSRMPITLTKKQKFIEEEVSNA